MISFFTDCSQRCTEGTLVVCAYCACSETVTGEVLSSDFMPLTNVSIAPSGAPYITINTTVTGGFFQLEGVCFGEEYSFQKEGYLDLSTVLAANSYNITMERYGKQVIFEYMYM